ncbi:MAG: HXXEE domain-containing protein, partial [Mogibacterium diversum]|nr:HXXEE domain-containing protein [Mogibacterium diversum]
IYFRTYIVWLGAFIAFSLHLFFHIIQSIIIKRYIPALSTSIILLPISLVLINTVIYNAKYSIFSITISSIFCLILMMLNLKFVHKLMDKVTEIIKICE